MIGLAGEGAPRSDTMILLTIDPLTKTAGMLSIPRDMWVNIPGFGYSRINTGVFLGRGRKLPGGGPALAVKDSGAIHWVSLFSTMLKLIFIRLSNSLT